MPLEYALQRRGTAPDPGPWRIPPPKQAALNSLLGVEQLPCQIVQKVKRKPFKLNVMVVGESGLGKTTFMNTLFNTDFTADITPEKPIKTVAITPVTYELTEEDTNLHLCIIDTPGFGDRVNRADEYESTSVIYSRHKKSTTFRSPIDDTRVHVCLYFISPTGHALKTMDAEAMKQLSSAVNLIPIIAKADTMTQQEKKLFKLTILESLERHNIPIYPTSYDEYPETLTHLEERIPFAIIGSDTMVNVGDKIVRGRQYDWGIVEVENEKYSDLKHLRELLFVRCLAELVDITHNKHYHDYRASILRQDGRPPSILECDYEYDLQIDNARKSIAEQLRRRDEDIRQNFVQLARQKEQALRKQEEELQKKFKELMKDIEEQKSQLASEEQAVQELLKAKQLAKSVKR
ncbi:hypothetical protein NQZ79_g7625 [Umbelopsis isabellina]|nr:hypothetical protein NQZ79_g7625 [Umbelopsis isabellina]